MMKKKPLAELLLKLPEIPAQKRKKVTVVTGMHRSGTSCITGMLVECGLNTGPATTLLNHNTSQKSNLKGHFENYNMVVINDRILNNARGSWKNPPPSDLIEAEGNKIGNHVNYFSKTFSGNIVKDPRLCLTLDIWKKWWNNIDNVIAVLRNPLSVAMSLNKRDGISIEDGLELWYTYNSRLAYHYITIVDYDKLLHEAGNIMHKLISIIGMETNIDTKFFDGRLNHNMVDENEILRLYPIVKDLYFNMKSRAI